MSFDATQGEIESLFSQVGAVTDVFVPTDRATGRPRGFAFVQFDERADAEEAIRRFDGYELRGRNLRVNEAEDRPRRFSGPPPEDSTFGVPPGRRSKPKGSRRNIRSKKRGF